MLAAAENALIAGLRAHALYQAKMLRLVDSLPKLGAEDLLRRYATDAPALYVLPGSLRVRDDLAYLIFTVAGVVRNVAGPAQARKGDGIDLGCDHLLIAATQAIHAKRLGDLGWSLVSAEMVDDDIFDKTGVAAVEMTFESGGMALPAEFALGDLDSFETFHADIDVAPHAPGAEHAKWLQEPPDYSTSAPDAQADVQLDGVTP